MKSSVIGYPRIGNLRELKFATEKYFRKEISADELEKEAKKIRIYNFELQKANGIDFIPSNDFSFYDNVLDTAFLLNAVPERYTQLGLDTLDTYFAAARGYQGEKGDVKALAMKKWYNTNYHYIVAEIDDATQIKLAGTKPFDLYKEALDAGVPTKPTVIGAYTFLKLAVYKGKKQAADFIEQTAAAYSELLQKFGALGAQWVQFEEPSLVKDMTADDIALFVSLYSKILSAKGSTKVLLQTYFGDVRDCYEQLVSLDFDGIGLDFTEGKKSIELVKANGFPKGKVLFAGVVNGKNIWRNNFEMTANIISELKKYADDIVIGTSCSLLHVPCTLDNETKLGEEYKKHFAFAQEKLGELEQLKEILGTDGYEQSPAFVSNKALHSEKRAGTNDEVRAKISALGNDDFVRLPAFSEREKIQKERFSLPLFPTTTIGSFPQTSDVKSARKAHRTGELSDSDYESFIKQKIAQCVALQEDIGLDVLVHGEYERNDMVEYFGECLDGCLFTEKARVQSYGTRCVKPPVIWGNI